MNDLANIELLYKRSKQENACGIAVDVLVVELTDMDPLRYSRNPGGL
jgi:hypothetical protein